MTIVNASKKYVLLLAVDVETLASLISYSFSFFFQEPISSSRHTKCFSRPLKITEAEKVNFSKDKLLTPIRELAILKKHGTFFFGTSCAKLHGIYRPEKSLIVYLLEWSFNQCFAIKHDSSAKLV